MVVKSMVVVLGLGGLLSVRAEAQAVWQADVQIQSLTVTPGRTLASPTRTLPGRVAAPAGGGRTALPASEALDVQVVVFSNNDDDAQNVRLSIFLPPESHPLSIPAGCSAPPPGGNTPTASVTCLLGAMGVNASRTVALSISRPPSYVVPRVGVFAWSDTPDPSTLNNHAEAVAP